MGSRVEQWCDRCGRLDSGDVAFKWGKPSEIERGQYSVGLCDRCCKQITAQIDREMQYRNHPKG